MLISHLLAPILSSAGDILIHKQGLVRLLEMPHSKHSVAKSGAVNLTDPWALGFGKMFREEVICQIIK